jgi:hypothetical protein
VRKIFSARAAEKFASEILQTARRVSRSYGRDKNLFYNKDLGVAEEAVNCEPVSAPNSLLTGKNTGNIVESSLLKARSVRSYAANSKT